MALYSKSNNPVCSVIIPALDEEETVGAVVEGVFQNTPPNTEVLVVDNNSTDNTKDIASAHGATVVFVESRGKGNALRTGARVARGEIFVFIDADGSYPPENIPALLDPLLKDEASVSYGSRILGEGYMHNAPKHRLLGSKLFAWFSSVLYMPISDILTGMYAVKKSVFEKFHLQATGFEIEADIFVQAHRMGVNIAEIPISYTLSNSSHLSPVKDGIVILNTLVRNKVKARTFELSL